MEIYEMLLKLEELPVLKRHLRELTAIVDAILSEDYQDSIENELEDKIRLLKEIYEVFDDIDD